MRTMSFEEALNLVSKEKGSDKTSLSEIVSKNPRIGRFIGYETLRLKDDEVRTVYICDGNLRRVFGLHNVRIVVGGISIWTRLACFSEKRCLLCDMRRNYPDRITPSSSYIVFNVYDPVDKKVKVVFLSFGYNLNYGILRELADKTNFDLSGLKVTIGKKKFGSNQKGGYLIIGYEAGKDGSPMRFKVLDHLRQKGMKLYNIDTLLDIQDDLRILEELGFDLSLYNLDSYRFDVLHTEEEDEIEKDLRLETVEDESIPVDDGYGVNLKVGNAIENIFISDEEIIRQSIELVKSEMNRESEEEEEREERKEEGKKEVKVQSKWMEEMEEKVKKMYDFPLTEEQLKVINSW